jgi:hypothetical protein
VGFVVDEVALGKVFSEYFGFPCQFSFHRLLHTYLLSSEAATIGQLVADLLSELSLNAPQETKKSTFDNAEQNNEMAPLTTVQNTPVIKTFYPFGGC